MNKIEIEYSSAELDKIKPLCAKGMKELYCLKNAEFISAVSINDRAFHYGDGCFTTARIVNQKIELGDRHQQRLINAAKQLKLQVDLHLITQSLSQLAEKLGDVTGHLKIVVSRGDSPRGYQLPKTPADLWLFYYPMDLKALSYQSIESGQLTGRLGLSMPSLVGIKSLNRLEQVMLKDEAIQKGWAEALVADVNGYIVEGVSSNCFIRINDQWISPELGYNGVHGVMRAEILSRMQQYGISCTLRAVHLDEIQDLQSLFFCNALNPMTIVSSFHQQPLDQQACIELFHCLQLNQMPSYVFNSI